MVLNRNYVLGSNDFPSQDKHLIRIEKDVRKLQKQSNKTHFQNELNLILKQRKQCKRLIAFDKFEIDMYYFNFYQLKVVIKNKL